MKKNLNAIISVFVSLQIGLAPIVARANEPTSPPPLAPKTEAPQATPPAVVLPNEEGGLSLMGETDKLGADVAGYELPLGSEKEKELNRPSLLAKKSIKDRTIHFTTQYIYFQMVMGLAALVSLSMNYENDPIALHNYLKTYTSPDRIGESVVSFGGFLYGDNKMQHFLKEHLFLNGPRHQMIVQQFGMATGLLFSTVIGELWNDKSIRLCWSSRGTDLTQCDAAYDTWVKTDRIVQYIPMMIQNGGSALLSGGVTKVAQTSWATTKAIKARLGGASKADQVVADAESLVKPAASKKKFLRFKSLQMVTDGTVDVLKQFKGGLAGGVVGLSVFMAVDAVVSSPMMKAYTRNYIAEQNSWLRRAKETVSQSNIFPIAWSSYYAYAVLSTLFPNYFPKIQDDKEKANWIREFDLDTFFKFFRLWAKYNIAARKESGEISLLNMFMPQPIATIKRESKVVDYPQDDFEMMRDAHEALLSSLQYSKDHLWQTYNVSQCSPSLSTASQLTFQQALQFYIGLSKTEKQCIVDINIYDNLVSYIDRSTKHRNFIMAPLLAATTAWIEAMSKFEDLAKISFLSYRTIVRNQFAVEHKFQTYTGDDNKPTPVLPLSDESKGYDIVHTIVKADEKPLNHEEDCADGDYSCRSVGEDKDENFLPTTFHGSNDGVGKVAITNNTDYLIAQMACGPDVKDTSAYYASVSAQTYETFVGKWARILGSGIEKVYSKIPALGYDEFKVFDDKIKDPNTALIYTPEGFYPRFIPPRIVTGNGDICLNPKTGNNTVRDGVFADGSKEYAGLLPYVLSHLQPEIMNNPKFPTIANFKNWYEGKVQPALDAGVETYQGVYNRIIEQEFGPSLLRSKFTDGCPDNVDCFRAWKVHKVAMGVYNAMEVEIRVLLGMLNEVYQYPTELMAQGRDKDDTNVISTSAQLREILKDKGDPAQLDTRRMIFTSEAYDTTLPKKKGEKEPPPEVMFKKDQPAMGNFEQQKRRLMDLEVLFLRSFRAKDLDMSADKNGLASFNVEQSDRDLDNLQNFFTATKVSEINDLQAKIAGLIFRALESVLQERNTYGKLLLVAALKDRKVDEPEPMRRKGQETVIKAYTKKPDPTTPAVPASKTEAAPPTETK